MGRHPLTPKAEAGLGNEKAVAAWRRVAGEAVDGSEDR